ncbi:hypothetical protein MNAN1_003252 [Malassezia nana]|uniref:Uncharacterized protein n=1 Tax=Malassezia nana TaxID=180528 RepID=A0AAF0ELI8_9BASI|nr:hypothetical protein MNAN1_003252 [Malassezia nana]
MLRASGRRASTLVHLSARRLQSTARTKSKHALLYSEIIPPVFRVLAYSTAAYFGMHLTWLALRNREESEAQAAELEQLRTDIQRAQAP